MRISLKNPGNSAVFATSRHSYIRGKFRHIRQRRKWHHRATPRNNSGCKTIFWSQKLTPQHAARAFFDFGGDLAGDSVDLLVGQRGVHRLQRHRDGDGFFAFTDMLTLLDIEHLNIGDQGPVNARRGAHDITGRDIAIDDEGKITVYRLER